MPIGHKSRQRINSAKQTILDDAINFKVWSIKVGIISLKLDILGYPKKPLLYPI